MEAKWVFSESERCKASCPVLGGAQFDVGRLVSDYNLGRNRPDYRLKRPTPEQALRDPLVPMRRETPARSKLL